MRKALSLLLVIVMIAATFILTGCNGVTNETTGAETTTMVTSETTVSEETTTEATTTTTEATTTTTEATTTVSETTTLPVFARFDFGTDTYAEESGLTSHEYLVSQLAYNKDFISISFTEDSWVITALRGFKSGISNTAFALNFDDLVTYDFEDDLLIKSNRYMKIRLKNESKNTMIAAWWKDTAGSYATTMVLGNMHVDTNSSEYKTYTYDLLYCACLASGKSGNATTESAFAAYVAQNSGAIYSNNWAWHNASIITGFEFHLLGSYVSKNAAACDTRSLIVQGAKVEVDYMVFGSSPEQLDGYHSYIESSSLAGA